MKRNGELLAALLLMCVLFTPAALAQGILKHPVNTPAQMERVNAIAAAMRANLPARAQVTQEKHMAVLAEPLISKGVFSLSKSGDIVWQIDEPFSVRYAVQGDEIIREVAGESETITASSEPSVYGFFRMFGQIFALDADALKQYFSIYLAPAATTGVWDMALVPSKAPLDEVVATLLISGRDGFLQKVTITEPGEDYSVLSFHYPSESSAESEAP